ncbi:MAG: DUF1127 domain-containing protein [Geminicoccaceae bacterium]
MADVLVLSSPARRQAGRPSLFATWRARRRERQELRRLLRMAPYLLVDIGLTPAQVAAEADKPFWRP